MEIIVIDEGRIDGRTDQVAFVAGVSTARGKHRPGGLSTSAALCSVLELATELCIR